MTGALLLAAGEYALSFAVSQTIMPWGETQEKLIDLLIKHGADINARDSHGNTALHMAVYHNKPQVFRYLCSEYKGTINQSIHNREGYTPLLMAVRLGNEEMFYVALREQSELSWEFDHIASYQMPMRELDTLEAGLAHEEYLKRLSAEGGGPQQDDAAASLFGRANGLGQANDAQRERDALKQEWLSTMENTIPEIAPPGLSALGIIVNHRYGHFLQNGILNEILNFKWKRYAFWDFAATCVCYMVLIILATVLAATKGTSKSVAWLEYTCFALVLFFWMLKAWDFYASLYGMQIKQEMPQLYPPPVKFPDGFELADGNASGRNFDLYEKAFKSTMPPSPALRRLSVWWQLVVKPHLELVSQRFTLTVVYEIALMLFLGCTTIHWITWIVNPDSFANRTMSDGFLASGLVFGWFYTWFFARSSQQLGPFVVMLVNMLLGDIVKRFALIYGTIILSYAAALSLLYRSSSTVEDGESCPFCTFSSSILTLFRTMVGDVAYEEYCPPEQESCVLVTFLFVGFTLMSNLVLLNLLIALMNTTYTTTMSDAEDQAMLQKAEIILATEARWKPVWRFFSKLSRNRRNNKVNPDNKQNTNDSCERLRLFRFGDPSSDPTNTTFYAHVNMYSDKYLQPKADTAAVHEAEGQPNSIQLQVPSMPGNQHRDSSTLGMIAALLNSRIRAQR